MTFILRKGSHEEQAPGTWWPMKAQDLSVIIIKCPKCRKIATLVRPPLKGEGVEGHDVESDGTVKPSLVCPNDECAFHEHVTLEGWKE